VPIGSRPTGRLAKRQELQEENQMNKLLLALIAAGLWANAALTFVRLSYAGSDFDYRILSELGSIESNISSIKSDTSEISSIKSDTSGISRIKSAVESMEDGTCSNSKIC
jgi:hypothetical protein